MKRVARKNKHPLIVRIPDIVRIVQVAVEP
jgi:hypothetical protein